MTPQPDDHMEHYTDLPSILKTDDGKNILIKGYFYQVRDEAIKSERDKFSAELLNQARNKAVELSGGNYVREWLKHALEYMK